MPDYQTLLPAQKAMVQIMAVNVDNCGLNTIANCLADLGFTNDEDGETLNIQSIQSLVKKLVAKGLLLKSAKGMCCPESIRQMAVHETLLDGTFPQVVAAIRENISLPEIDNPRVNPFANYQQLIRALQIALFTSSSTEEIYNISNYFSYNFFNNEFYENNGLIQILNRPFLPEIIEKINPAIRISVLSNLLNKAVLCLDPAEEIILYINNNYQALLPDGVATISVVEYHLTCGKTTATNVFLEKFDEQYKAEQLSRKGWLEFICGNYQEALGLFSTNITILKKRAGKRKLFLKSTAGLFHLLALLQSGQTVHLNEALEYIEIAQKNNYPLLFLIEPMKYILMEQLGQLTPEADTYLPNYTRDPLSIFLSTLFLAWINKNAAQRNIPQLNRTRDKALKGGYIWLAAELSALLAFLGHSKKKNSTIAAKLHESCSTVSCVNIIREQSQWEKTLNGLLAITSNGQKGKEQSRSEQRLIWLFSHEEQFNYTNIAPRIQKMSKKGSWTKGRPVALKTLYHDYNTMEGLTDQDQRVCQAIKEDYYRSSWRYGKTEYVLSDKLALPALVGHPLLFLENSPGVRVELVVSEPEMRIKKANGKLQLSIFPDTAKVDMEIMVVKDTPTRYKIIRFTDEHMRIIQLLGEGLTIPRSGEKMVQQVVDSLASVVTVNSDLETATTATLIQGDCRPYVHIIPHRDGIKLEFLVKPCATGNSSFRPGRGGKNVLTEIDGKKIQATRDFAKEKELQSDVIRSCPTLNHLEEIDHQWLVDDPEDALEILLELKECGDAAVLEWPQGETISVRREVSASSFSMQIKKERDWFKATGSLEIDDSLSLSLRQLLDILSSSTGRFIPLDDGTFLTITSQLRKRLDELRAYSEGHGKGVRFVPLAALALEEFTSEAGKLQSDKAWKQHCKQLRELVTPELPSTLQVSLRDYQRVGFNWLAQLSHWGVGGCLADDMGLGKTVQALSVILLRAGQGPTLVVAPLSVTSNWIEEAHRFAPTLHVKVFGPGDRKKVLKELQPFDLLIVSYGLLPLEADILAEVQWQTVVLDEAQAIKNMQTKRSKAAMALQAEFRLITTGTPVENHLGEFWTLFHFLNPGLLGSYKQFNDKFAIPIEREQNGEARNRLRNLIRPFILRRLKSDVLQELPAKTEIVLEVEMSSEELLLYEAQRLKSLERINANAEEGAGQQYLQILGEIMKLRRLCCNPSLILPDTKIASSKLKVFANTVDELLANNHKALIFSQFVGHLQIISDYLDTKKISYQYLDGSTPIKKRKERINSFQNGEGDLFLISLKAGGAGLNLTAADYVIHMDPWWNPAVEDQASDRVHRIGQQRPVTVYRLIVKNSIEEQIVDMHRQKRDIADSLLEGTDIAGKISAKELLTLLQNEDG